MHSKVDLQAPPDLLWQEALLRPAPRTLLLRRQLALVWARLLWRPSFGLVALADSSTGFATALGTSGAGGFGASPFGGGGKIRLLAYPGHFMKAGGGGLTFPGNVCSAGMPVKAAEELGSDRPEDFASCASTCS